MKKVFGIFQQTNYFFIFVTVLIGHIYVNFLYL
jgi:hypothetical protein